MGATEVKAGRRPASAIAMRARLLRGAAEAFGRLGYPATRVEDIIQAAGVSRPTFYKAFDGKDAAFQALSLQHHREIRERIERALHGVQDARGQVAAAIDAFLRWRAELGPIGRVLDLEARSPGTRVRAHRTRTLSAIVKLTAERMREAGRAEADPVMIYALMAALESIADQLLLKAPVEEASLRRAVDNALRIFGASLAQTGDELPPLPAPPPATPKRRRPRA